MNEVSKRPGRPAKTCEKESFKEEIHYLRSEILTCRELIKKLDRDLDECKILGKGNSMSLQSLRSLFMDIKKIVDQSWSYRIRSFFGL